jgi:hypothetical protein
MTRGVLRRLRFGFFVGIAGLIAPALAPADIVFFSGDAPNVGLQGLNLVGGTNLSTVTGATQQLVNGSPVGVSFTSSTTTDMTAANGLASISPGGTTTLSQLTSVFESGFGASYYEFNLSPDRAGSITISALDNEGQLFTSTAFSVNANANQTFYAQGINGQLINSLSISATVPLNFVRQFRVAGVAANPAIPPIPEPSTVVLLGLGGAGLAASRLRRRPRGTA